MAACAQAATALERVTQRRPGRSWQRRTGEPADEGELVHRVLTCRLGPGAEPAQPAAHGRGRDARPGADPPVARPGWRHPGRGADDLDRVGAPGREPRRQSDVRRHEPQCARCGRSRAVAPSGRWTARSRPYPHRFSRPARQDGQATIPPARSQDAAAASAHSSTEGLPGHDSTMPRPGQRPPGGARCSLPAFSRGPRPRTPHTPGNDTMTTIRPGPRPGDRHRAAPCSRRRRARKRTPATNPARNAHAERRQPPSKCSERTARNNPAEQPSPP